MDKYLCRASGCGKVFTSHVVTGFCSHECFAKRKDAKSGHDNKVRKGKLPVEIHSREGYGRCANMSCIKEFLKRSKRHRYCSHVCREDAEMSR